MSVIDNKKHPTSPPPGPTDNSAACFIFTGGKLLKEVQSAANESDYSYTSSVDDSFPPSSPVASVQLGAPQPLVSSHEPSLSEDHGSTDSSEDRKVKILSNDSSTSLAPNISDDKVIHVQASAGVTIPFKSAAEKDKNDPIENVVQDSNEMSPSQPLFQRSVSCPSTLVDVYSSTTRDETLSLFPQLYRSKSCPVTQETAGKVEISLPNGTELRSNPAPADGVFTEGRNPFEAGSSVVDDLRKEITQLKDFNSRSRILDQGSSESVEAKNELSQEEETVRLDQGSDDVALRSHDCSEIVNKIAQASKPLKTIERSEFNGVQDAKRSSVVIKDEIKSKAGPVQCTSKIRHNSGTKRSQNSTSGPKFREKEFYSNGSDYVCIYSISDSVQREIDDIDFRRLSYLGKGGNSEIFSCNQFQFAIKETVYDETLLNLILQTQHTNIVPLLGVVLLDPKSSCVCYHILPKMTYDLHHALKSIGALRILATQSDHDTWAIVESNAIYISKCVLRTIERIESQGIRHGDVKGKNVLISCKQACKCADILHCKCPEGSEKKYGVFLADFDHMICPADCNDVQKVGGTYTYRPPEQCEIDADGHVTEHRQKCSDVWSFGVFLLDVILGPITSEDNHNTNIVCRRPKFTKLTCREEVVVSLGRLNTALEAGLDCPGLGSLAKLAARCLERDYRERPTAAELLCRKIFSEPRKI